MIFEDYIRGNKEAFIQKVVEISNYLQIKPEWLMTVMWSESRLNHLAQNPISPYPVGLIQFIPKTAEYLGTSIASLLAMSNVQQLDYVKKYFAAAKGRINSFYDLYLYTFFMLAVGKPDDFVLQSRDVSAGSVAAANKPFDLNGDNQITVGEFKAYLNNKFKDIAPEVLETSKAWIVVPIVGLAAGLFILYRIKKNKKDNDKVIQGK